MIVQNLKKMHKPLHSQLNAMQARKETYDLYQIKMEKGVLSWHLDAIQIFF